MLMCEIFKNSFTMFLSHVKKDLLRIPIAETRES